MARGLHNSWWNSDYRKAQEKVGKTQNEPKYKVIKAYEFSTEAEARTKISDLEKKGYEGYRIVQSTDGNFTLEQNYAKDAEKVDPELNFQMNGKCFQCNKGKL